MMQQRKGNKSKSSRGSVNPFEHKTKNKKKTVGKRVGKSKKEKANNQLNRRVR